MNGSVQVKRGTWYAVIYYKDEKGIARQKWINTGLSERGNKRQAKEFLEQELNKFDETEVQGERRAAQRLKNNKEVDLNDRFLPFGEFCEKYIDGKKDSLSPQVYHNYINNYVKPIKKHFGKRKIRLVDITTEDITEYYDSLEEKGLSGTSIKHYEDVIRPALKFAYKNKLIPDNPYDFVPKISRDTKPMSFFDEKEMSAFFEAIKGHKLEMLFKIAAYYGMRRSEILGLKWNAIDFNHKTISVQHKMIMVNDHEPYFSDALKTKSSRRTFPLLPIVEEMLLAHTAKIEKNREALGDKYIEQYADYVFVDDNGKIIYPNYVTKHFHKIIKDNGFKPIHFHELRHSCASIMLKNGVQMKQIQDWLGHANYAVTANIYSHLDYSAKLQSAAVIDNALSFQRESKEEKDMDIVM